MKSYRDLLVWQKAMDMAVLTYDVTRAFPPDERFGLVSQMRRAGVSVASNIAEGHGRDADGSFAHFLRMAQGSLKELETQAILAKRIGHMNEGAAERLLSDADEVGRMLRSLIEKVVKRTSRS